MNTNPIVDALANGNAHNGTPKFIAGLLTGPLGAVGLSVWLLTWFMGQYSGEQAKNRELLEEVKISVRELRMAIIRNDASPPSEFRP